MARSSGRGLLLFCLSSVLLSVALAEFLVEKGTLKYYDKENKAWKSMTMALANFGKPLYGANTQYVLQAPVLGYASLLRFLSD